MQSSRVPSKIWISDLVYDTDGMAAVTDCGVVPIPSSRGRMPLKDQIWKLFFSSRRLQNKCFLFGFETGVCTCAAVCFCICVRMWDLN